MKPFGLNQQNRVIIDLSSYVKKAAEWTTAFINNLPDSSFAYIEPGGKKDADGKTTPRSLRHLPYKDAGGKVDLPHVRNALARLPQSTTIPDGAKAGIKTKLQNALDSAKQGDDATGDDMASDVSDAPSKIEIMPTGVWDTPYHGAFAITDEDLQEMVSNWQAGLRKGLPIDYEHDDDGGAAGWITNLYVAPSSSDPTRNSLWGDVEWTPQAEQAIKDGVYKYFSPEFYPEDYCDPESGEDYDNVLIGGGLTNRPLFKNLTPVMAQDGVKDKKKVLTANSKAHTIYLYRGNESDMQLEDVRTKNLDELSDEEKQFLADHKDELNADEQKKFELTDAGAGDEGAGGDDDADDGSGAGEGAGGEEGEGAGGEGGVQGKEKDKTIKITANEYKTLQKMASEGARAMSILERKQAHEKTKGWIYSDKGGKFPTTAHEMLTDFLMSLDSKQVKDFEAIVAKMPEADLIGVRGSDQAVDSDAGEKLQRMAEEKMKADPKLTFADALKQARNDEPDLSKEYNKQVEGK